MVFQLAWVFAGILSSSGFAQAASNNAQNKEDLRDSFSVTSSATALEYSELHYRAPSRLQVVIPSLVVHGMQPDPRVAAAMPRRMDGTGDEVVTPGLGLEYKSPTGLLIVGAALRDCFDNLAGTLQVGGNWRIDRDSDWGLTAGIYARQTPMVCPPGTKTDSGCYTVDGLDFKFVTYVNGQSVDIIPLPFLHYSYNLYRSRDWQVNFKVMANFIVNEVGLEIPL